MAKARRMKEKEPKIKSNRKKSNFLSNLFIFIVMLVIIGTIYFFFFNDSSANIGVKVKNLFENRPKEVAEEDKVSKSEINKEDFIKGLENVKILKVDVKGSKDLSIITIQLKNESNEKINSSKLHLSLYDNNNKYLFSTSLKMPNIEANSEISFSLACSSKLENVENYIIELDK